MLKQVSIYAENKKGMLRDITGILAKENINIWGSVTNDSAEYGIIRMVVDEPERCMELLQANDYICRLTKVIAVVVEDKVGNLNHLLNALYESFINVDYVYLSFDRESAKPIMVLHTPDPDEVEKCLTRKGFTLI